MVDIIIFIYLILELKVNSSKQCSAWIDSDTHFLLCFLFMPLLQCPMHECSIGVTGLGPEIGVCCMPYRQPQPQSEYNRIGQMQFKINT